MNAFRKLLKVALPYRAKGALRRFLFGYDLFAPSFAAAGEDMVLRHLVGSDRQQGFFVDVGAFHPVHSSNTYFFYTQGWRGINIDARPGSMKEFQAVRPEDINVEMGVGLETGEKTFYMLDVAPKMNTFSTDFLDQIGMSGHITGQAQVTIMTLADILHHHMPDSQQIDFMTIDVEGRALDVVASNDWSRFRPAYVLIEEESTDPGSSELIGVMQNEGYSMIGFSPMVLGKVYNFLFADCSAGLGS